MAAKATGFVICTATRLAQVPAGTLLAREDGARFVTRENAIAPAGESKLEVVASRSGTGGETEVGTELTFVGSPPPGLEAKVVVAPGGIALERAAAPAEAAPAIAPAPPSPPIAPPRAAPRRVLAHFVTSGPTFHGRLGIVEKDHGDGRLDVRVELEHGRVITLERLERRPLPQIVTYPSWEEAPAAS